MGWSVGYDKKWGRDIGYGVPAICDHHECNEKIDRGLSYVCGGEPYGGDKGCGLYFCENHLAFSSVKGGFVCKRCREDMDPFEPKPDTKEWVFHKLTDKSWMEWREDNTEEVIALTKQIQGIE